MINPMDIPGLLRGLSIQPLNPVKYAEHMDYFVDVDDSLQAFSKFQEDFADPRWLSNGAIVITTGREQTGKTALLYRCAHWLTGNLGDPAKVVKVLDCSRAPVRADLSIESRLHAVCAFLKNRAYQEQLIADARLLDMDTPGDFFSYLTGAIRPEVVIVAILPNSEDLLAEIAEYAQLVPERVMLLTETSYVTEVDRLRPRIERSRAVSSILELGLLDPPDGDLFYDQRRGLYPTDADIPSPTAGTLKRLVKARETTIGDLQRLLYDVYADIPSQPTPVSEVTYEYITDYNYRVGGRR